MANGDRFIVSITAVGIPTASFPADGDITAFLRQTQLDYSHVNIATFEGQFGDQTYPQNGQGAYIIQVTADDVFTGNSANTQTVKDQFDAVFSRYMVSYQSQITGQQVIPAHTTVATHVNPNTGQVQTVIVPTVNPSQLPKPPVDTRNILDRTFFSGAGALTGTGMAILLVLGVVVITKNR